jgi:hypothetical protein
MRRDVRIFPRRRPECPDFRVEVSILTVRYLGIEVDDALHIAEQIEL